MERKRIPHNLAQSLREAEAMTRLAQDKDKYGNSWGLQLWPMNDAYCSYKDCDFNQLVAIALPGQKCPHCGRPLSWSGKWLVDKEIELEDGRKRTVRVREYREPLRKWKMGDGFIAIKEGSGSGDMASDGSNKVQQG